MLIRDLFATAIVERIEPVVKVGDRRPEVLASELGSLVVTPQWERFLHLALDAYTNAADRDDEGGVGIWISGFFGSGKSLLMKTLGALLVGGEIGQQRVHDLFLQRLPSHSPDRADIQRFLAICDRTIATTVVGGNLHTEQANAGDPLALLAYKLFARSAGYSSNWPMAWAVEHHIDERGRLADYQRRAEALTGKPWSRIARDTSSHIGKLFQAAAEVLPEDYAAVADVERSITAALQEGGVTPSALVHRLRTWCVARDGTGRRHKLVLQLDELGQWIRGGGNSIGRIMEVQGLIETAATAGGGRVWLVVTAHGDVQALQANVQQELYASINQRFALQCKLSNADINQVVEERVLRKKPAAGTELAARFAARSGELADLGTLVNAQRAYPPPTAVSFPLCYPYLPWTLAAIPDVVRGIAQAGHRGDELTGSTRTLIGVVQGAIIDTRGFLDSPAGRLLALADLYDGLSTDMTVETRTDIDRVGVQVPGSTPLTERTARALFLLGEADHIPTSLENVALAMADSLDTALPPLRAQVKAELDRLVAAGYAKLVADQYIFLNTQQRGFQDRVRERQAALRENTFDLSQALKEYDSEDALRFDRVQVAGREMPLKLAIDGRVVRNPAAAVALQVYSPFQRALDPSIADDARMGLRSGADPANLYFRMDDARGLRDALALALATAQEADLVLSSPQSGPAEQEVARQAKTQDVPSYRDEVRRLLAQAVKGGALFFNGSRYSLTPAGSAAASVRETLAESRLLPTIYSRLRDLPQRIADEEKAVKAALAGNAENPDLRALGVYHADGTLNEGHALLSTLRSLLPAAEEDGGLALATDLRERLDRPPYGWDGNAVKVGLALLLRASACRLVENGKPITDPSSPDALRLLTKEQSFKALRVQGVKSDLDTATLRLIRAEIEALFGSKPALVAATLHAELGRALVSLESRAGALTEWLAAAQCPPPPAFAAGRQRVEELTNTGALAPRLRAFHEGADALRQYCALLENLEGFRKGNAARFGEMRDVYTRMHDTTLPIPALRTFVDGWRAVTAEGAVTDPSRWHELEAAYHAAQAAVSEQAAAWRRQAEEGLADLETRLTQGLRAAGVPEERQEEERTAVRQRFGSLKHRLGAPAGDVVSAQAAVTAVQALRLELPMVLREVQNRYRPPASAHEIHLTWQELAGSARIATAEELDALLQGLRGRIAPLLSDRKIAVID